MRSTYCPYCGKRTISFLEEDMDDFLLDEELMYDDSDDDWNDMDDFEEDWEFQTY